MNPRQETIEELQDLGLTEYEARCFIALTSVDSATATELGQICDVPRSRVYDTAEGLAEKGIIEIRDGTPTEYQSLPVEQFSEQFQREYQSRIETVTEYLEANQSSRSSVGNGIWHLTDRDHVLTRAQTLIDNAERDVIFMEISDDLLLEECLVSLEAAHDRGIDLTIIAEPEEIQDRLNDRLGTVISPSSLDWLSADSETKMVGRVLMTDRHSVLVATVHHSFPTGDTPVVGMWARGQHNPIVVTFNQLFDHYFGPT